MLTKGIFRRMNYIINKEFQYKLIALFLILELVLVGIFISFGFKLKAEVIMMTTRTLLKDTVEASNVVERHYSKGYNRLILLCILLIVIITSIFLVFMIIYSHSIAGAIHSLQRHLKNISEQKFRKMTLRQRDQFQTIPDHVNQLIKSLIEEKKADVERLRQVRREIDVDVSRAKELVDDIIAEKEQLIEPDDS
ncbi:hypothetical protein ACFL27_12370 [candidate division CSSED10-310 bacterium]|uniref:HAMP domain-containing protein n=1 Tax=candidate division CSSED10-310 bacterium TaxID=2855610 RepID=A0ABV6YXQ4_UNCC1